MNNLIDQEYLKTDQYKDAKKLKSRISLHSRFSKNKQGMYSWIFDQLELSKNCKILELGCGTGALWKKNINKVQTGWEITLSDFSVGMIREA